MLPTDKGDSMALRKHGTSVDSGRRQRRILSKPFVIGIAVIGCLAVATPAFAGSNSTGNVIYYAETGPDGIIHCAGYDAAIGTGSGLIASETNTYVAKDLYCVNADSYPANYFEARSQIYNDDYQICADTNWDWNSSGASTAVAEIDASDAQCGNAAPYFTLGQNDAAVNLSWQYWSEGTQAVNP
jgi:hypothetical protein